VSIDITVPLSAFSAEVNGGRDVDERGLEEEPGALGEGSVGFWSGDLLLGTVGLRILGEVWSRSITRLR
jgi:hypothetical protein